MSAPVNGSPNGTNVKNGDVVVRHVEPEGSPAAKAAAICSEIDHTRAQMAGTINALEERLSPARMKEQVLSQIRDAKERLKSEVREDLLEMKHSIKSELDEAKLAMREATIGRVEHLVQSAKGTIHETGSTVMMTIRDNPIPAFLTGIGLTWLIMNARSRRASHLAEYRGHGIGVRKLDSDGLIDRGQRAIAEAAHTVQDETSRAMRDARDAAGNLIDKAGTAVHDAESRVGTMVNQAGETVSTLAHQAQDKVGHLAHDAQDKIGHFAHDAEERAMMLARQTRAQAQHLEQSAERTMRENPLAVGAAAFALGAAVGLAIPHTRQEDQLIGAARDRLFKKAEEIAEGAVASAKDTVEGLVQNMGSSGQDRGPRGDERPGASAAQSG
jgi:ElaB/YqjD/DUF883 family membrane-anchored ribosome-binding protein